jgi:hypothetical protein
MYSEPWFHEAEVKLSCFEFAAKKAAAQEASHAIIHIYSDINKSMLPPSTKKTE